MKQRHSIEQLDHELELLQTKRRRLWRLIIVVMLAIVFAALLGKK